MKNQRRQVDVQIGEHCRSIKIRRAQGRRSNRKTNLRPIRFLRFIRIHSGGHESITEAGMIGWGGQIRVFGVSAFRPRISDSAFLTNIPNGVRLSVLQRSTPRLPWRCPVSLRRPAGFQVRPSELLGGDPPARGPGRRPRNVKEPRGPSGPQFYNSKKTI
eukprot:1168336-Prorocentrum_minimum.AAC.1